MIHSSLSKYFIQIISGKKDKRPKKAIQFVPNALK